MPGAQYRFPALDASPEDIKDFQTRYFSRLNTYRTRHMERINKALYYVIGRQWVERDDEIIEEWAGGFIFRDMPPDSEVELPRPVTNFISPAVDTEFSTLSKRQWVPKIPTYSRDPRMEAAAKVADDVLNDRLRKLGWEDIRDRFILNLILMGTATIHSFWRTTARAPGYRCPTPCAVHPATPSSPPHPSPLPWPLPCSRGSFLPSSTLT